MFTHPYTHKQAAQQESYQARSAETAAVLSLQAKEGELSGVVTRYRASEDDKAGLQLLVRGSRLPRGLKEGSGGEKGQIKEGVPQGHKGLVGTSS